eukprot:Nk52_evm50s1073 gene=Nk52_evmTU50s1073
MAASSEFDFDHLYCAVKHSWRGKYTRVFAIGPESVATFSPSNWENTNEWRFGSEFFEAFPSSKSSEEFKISVRQGRKNTTMTFVTGQRASLLTDIQRYGKSFSQTKTEIFNVQKNSWTEKRLPVKLAVTTCSIDQVDAQGKVLKSYLFKDISALARVSDVNGGFIIFHGLNRRMHFFVSEDRLDILKKIAANSGAYIGHYIPLQKEDVKSSEWDTHRFGKYSSDESITSYTEFFVQKISTKRTNPTARIFAITENSIVERDSSSYAIVSSKPLEGVFAIVRYEDDAQKFAVEFKNGQISRYLSTDRDTLLSSFLDSVRASGNKSACVKMRETSNSLRIGSQETFVEEEVESMLLKSLGQFRDGASNLSYEQVVSRFNACVDYSGLRFSQTQDGIFAENKEKLISLAVNAILGNGEKVVKEDVYVAAEQFNALRRLMASKAGFAAFTEIPGFKDKLGRRIESALRMNNNGLSFAAIDLLGTLMQPMHDDYDIAQEQANKLSVLASKKFLKKLVELLHARVMTGTGCLVVTALLDFFVFALCDPYSDTTNAEQFDTILEVFSEVAGRSIFKLFSHPSIAVVRGAGMIMRSLIEEGDKAISDKMKYSALAEAAILKHIHNAIYIEGSDYRQYQYRELSKHLLGLWATDNEEIQSLIPRMFPAGLVSFLYKDDEVPEKEAAPSSGLDKTPAIFKVKKIPLWVHWGVKIGLKDPGAVAQEKKVVVFRRRRKLVKSTWNWKLFFYYIKKDFSQSDLIWNHHTREELRESIEVELRAFNHDKELGGNTQPVAWNYGEYEVNYNSLGNEIRIGDHYLRLLLEEGAQTIHNPKDFFSDLYHRYLLAGNAEMKSACLQAMTIVYGQCHEAIGPFNDIAYILSILLKIRDRVERDRLLLFLEKLMVSKKNVKLFADANGCRVLIDYLTLCHYHVERAVVPLESNVIEAAEGTDLREVECEWYFSDADQENRQGPFSRKQLQEFYSDKEINADTLCWAQGMDSWKKLKYICQLKWLILGEGNALLNDGQIARIILDMFLKMSLHFPSRDANGSIIRPLPRIKKMLSEGTCLSHICQVFLTFDPPLVDRSAKLLDEIMRDNPALPHLYLTGVFYFAMMYSGSNILPIARFLEHTHDKQAFKTDGSKPSSNSALSQILPDAMICVLMNHGHERFAEIFLGEFDTPESIWNRDMRMLMIRKVAVHLSEFTPRLLSNAKATYQYHPLPLISYPQLEGELYCNIYYLRHLCNTKRFPDWPIKNHIDLLLDILEAWKNEIEKKPSSLSGDLAKEMLGLEPGVDHDDSVIRKAYFKLAAKYHPDKNPDGREMFENIAEAYEFLSSKKGSQGTDGEILKLILKSQAILYSRYADILCPYKYSGYPQLIKTMSMETEDDMLFSKETPLLPEACAVARYTISTSPLNAEELCREGGIEVMAKALDRCSDVIGKTSSSADTPVQISENILACFGAGAKFELVRSSLKQFPQIIQNVTLSLYCENAPGLVEEAILAVDAFGEDYELKDGLFHKGVLYHLLLFVFQYDYTLDEGEVSKDKESNVQEVINTRAKMSCSALASLCGLKPGMVAHEGIRNVLNNLLLRYIVDKMDSEGGRTEALKLLAGNCETPYMIWNNASRTELLDYLKEEQSLSVRNGDHDPSRGMAFRYESRGDELLIGDVFVRIYNEQPTFIIEKPQQLCNDIVCYLKAHLETEESAISNDLKMVFQALLNLMKNHQGVEEGLIPEVTLLFSCMDRKFDADVIELIMEVISVATTNAKCIEAMASSKVLVKLMLLIESTPSCHMLILSVLQAVSSNSKAVADLLQHGVIIYVLDLFCTSNVLEIRKESAALFAKMSANKLHGMKVNLLLLKFLPRIFMDAMKESPESALSMFNETHENPELIWNEEARSKVKYVVSTMRKELLSKQQEDSSVAFKLPAEFRVLYGDLQGELCVEGVFVRLYNKQPGWSLRNPRQFLVGLLDVFFDICSKGSTSSHTDIEDISMAICNLFSAQPNFLDQMVPLGHIGRFYSELQSGNFTSRRASASVLNKVSTSRACVEHMAGLKVVEPWKKFMVDFPDSWDVAGEALQRIFECSSPIVLMSVKQGLIAFLLKCLESGCEAVENPAATRAYIVKALKAASADANYGEQVTKILGESIIWKTYRDQRHDLFIANKQATSYLTGPATAQGYLTQGPVQALPDAPPPIANTKGHDLILPHDDFEKRQKAKETLKAELQKGPNRGGVNEVKESFKDEIPSVVSSSKSTVDSFPNTNGDVKKTLAKENLRTENESSPGTSRFSPPVQRPPLVVPSVAQKEEKEESKSPVPSRDISPSSNTFSKENRQSVKENSGFPVKEAASIDKFSPSKLAKTSSVKNLFDDDDGDNDGAFTVKKSSSKNLFENLDEDVDFSKKKNKEPKKKLASVNNALFDDQDSSGSGLFGKETKGDPFGLSND